MKPGFLAAILFLFPLVRLLPQEAPRFELFNTRVGLCHDRITSLYQDTFGFLWIGTENGLSRFDGSHFKNFFPNTRNTSSISSEVIFSILPDGKGNFWLETPNGLTLRNPASGFHRFLMYPQKVQTRQEARFYGTAIWKGKVWMQGGGQSLAFFDPDLQKILPPEMAAFPPFGGIVHRLYSSVSSIPSRPDSSLIVFTTKGIYRCQPSVKTNRFYPLSMVAGSAFPLFLSRDLFYFSIWEKGLYILNLRSGKFENYRISSDQKLPNIIQAFLPVSADEWWMGTEGGLYSFNNKSGKSFRIPLPNEIETPLVVKSLLSGKDGIVWVGTENGLLKMDPKVQGFQYQKVLETPELVYENQIYDVLDEPDLGRTLIVSRSGALSVLAGSEVIRTRILRDASGKPLELTRILKDSRGQYWLASRWQVFHLDPATLQIKPFEMPSRREGRAGLVWILKEDPLGRIWFGLSRDGIVVYDPKDQSRKYLGCEENNFCPLNIWDIQIDAVHKRVWVATDNEGLWEADLASLQFKQWHQQNTPDLPSDQIVYLAQDWQHRLWFSTPAGLCRFDWQNTDQDRFHCLTAEHGLPANFVEGLQLDNEGNLWGGTTGKLVRLNPNTLAADVFDYRYGIDFTPFPLSHIINGPSGEMFAGGKRGFLRWFPQKIIRDTAEPKLVLSGIAVDGFPLKTSLAPELLQQVFLKPGQSDFSLEWTSIDFSLPENNKVAWKLEGYDVSWMQGSPVQKINYSQVPPGSYVFRVRNLHHLHNASNDIRLNIHLAPFFWQTTWFKVLVFLTMLLFLWAVYTWRIRQIRAAENEKQEFQKRIAEIEMAALRAQMNPHFVFNSLNSINRFIQLSDPDTASDYLTKFARLIRLVLDNSREDLVSLEQEIQAIRLYVELEELRFSGRFHHVIEVDDNLDMHGIDIPPLLIQPYVENAIWHGLMHKDSNDGLLMLSIAGKGKMLEIVVQDNGIGREAAAAIKSKSATRHKSHSTEMGRERLDYFRQLYNKEVRVEIQDLHDDQGRAAGTRVILCLQIFD